MCFSARRTARSCSSRVDTLSRSSSANLALTGVSGSSRPACASAPQAAQPAPACAPARATAAQERQQFAAEALEVELAHELAQLEPLLDAEVVHAAARSPHELHESRALLGRQRGPASSDYQ